MPARGHSREMQQQPHEMIAHDVGKDDGESMYSVRIYVAEFIGTFFLCFGIIATRGLTPEGLGNGPASELVGVALVHMLLLLSLAASFGDFSGGHFNPAVTLAFVITKQCHWLVGIIYAGIQFIAGLCAGAVALAVVPTGVTAAAPRLGNIAGIHVGHAFGVEFLGTFFLLLTIFTSGVSGHGGATAYIAIGSALGVGVLIAGPISNACFNPARALGAAVVANQDVYVWTNFWLYIIAPFAASLLVAAVWGLAFQKPSDKSKYNSIIDAWLRGSEEDDDRV